MGPPTGPSPEAFGPMHQDRPVISLALTLSGTEHQRNPRSLPEPQILGRSQHSLWSLNKCPEARKKQHQALTSVPRLSYIPDPKAKFQPCSRRTGLGQVMSQMLQLPVPKVAGHSSFLCHHLYISGATKEAKREVGFSSAHGFRRIFMHTSRGDCLLFSPWAGRFDASCDMHDMSARPCVSKTAL